MCAVRWNYFIDIIADQSGVVGHSARTRRAMSPVGALCPPPQDSSSEVIPAVGYARLPLPSVDNSVMPELVWVPALPQPKGRAADREVPVPRWRLAREGPFLEERSTESIRSLGPGCAFRNTTYRVSDYAEPTGDYGLLLSHSRFVECSSSVGDSGSTNFPEIRLSRQRFIYSAMWGSCKLMLMYWTSTRFPSRRRHPGLSTIA